ncbi:hypothetical protein [Pseudomonas mosselii]|uniref:hypothetical protein n=1 Tax=Pseudomonas mosselii TaxID=78327 RepID=UPI001F31BB08|nr:hypothetical protein [Pseudomonas mosselii]
MIARPVTASIDARQMIGYVHGAALLRFAGQHMTQLVVPLRAGEYLKLLDEGLQARTDALLGQLDQTRALAREAMGNRVAEHHHDGRHAMHPACEEGDCQREQITRPQSDPHRGHPITGMHLQPPNPRHKKRGLSASSL